MINGTWAAVLDPLDITLKSTACVIHQMCSAGASGRDSSIRPGQFQFSEPANDLRPTTYNQRPMTALPTPNPFNDLAPPTAYFFRLTPIFVRLLS